MNWFNDNYFKMNTDKCHLLITNHENDVSAIVGSKVIQRSKSVKLLGVHIDNKLDFSEHISNICNKVNQKVHALRRISHFINKDKLRKIMKTFIETQFGYCPLIWMFHKMFHRNLQRLATEMFKVKNNLSPYS